MDPGQEKGLSTSHCKDNPWAHWLQEIAQLPSDSSWWDSVEGFLNEVRRVAAEKEGERSAVRNNLRQALDDLARTYPTEIRYFRLEQPTSWDASRVSKSEAISLTEEVGRLAEFLAKAHELRGKHCDTIEEDERRQADLRTLRDEIQATYHKLYTLRFSTEEHSPPLVADQPPPFPTPSSPTASDLSRVPEKNESPPVESAQEEGQMSDQPQVAEIPIPELLNPIPFEIPAAVHDVTLPAAQEAEAKASLAPPQAISSSEAHQEKRIPSLKKQTCELTDQEIARAILQASDKESEEDVHNLLVEQQLRWLMKGQNLRAYLAARYVEEHEAEIKQPNDTGDSQLIPAWLCWFAVLVSDPGACRLDFDIAEFIPHLSALGQQPEPHQRFFLAWLCAGLLGEEAPRCIQAAQPHLSKGIFEAEWLKESSFFRFCIDHLAEPASRGRRLQISTRQSPESLRQRSQKAIKAASEITTLGNYGNTAVTRYWLRLVGKEGPVYALLNQARSGSFPKTLPEPEYLATDVDEWSKIQSSYRNNILKRLSTFLDHLREAAALHNALQSQPQSNPSVLQADQITEALRDGEALVDKLKVSTCPSVAGYRTVTVRLGMLVPKEDRS